MIIESGGRYFYTWYNDGAFYQAKNNLVNDFINGKCSTVNVTYSSTRSIFDMLLNTTKVCEIKVNGITYYSIEQEKQTLTKNKQELFFVFPFLIIGFGVLTLVLFVGSKVIVFKR